MMPTRKGGAVSFQGGANARPPLKETLVGVGTNLVMFEFGLTSERGELS